MVTLLGDEWTLLLVREAVLGARRYAELKARLPISDAVLTNRLQRLCAQGLLERRIYSEAPLRAEYVVTDAGRALWPVLFGIWNWERCWVPGRALELPSMVHRDCGAVLEPVLTCRACDAPLLLQDLSFQWGPSGGWQRSVPAGGTRRRSNRSAAGQAGLYPETMAILGNRWSSAILAAALLGTTRFSDFERRLAIPAALLSERLSAFCEAGVFAHTLKAGQLARREYRLTAKGEAFLPIVLTMLHWAGRWLAAEDEPPAMLVTHKSCGQPLVPRWRCTHCDQTLRINSIIPVEPDA